MLTFSQPFFGKDLCDRLLICIRVDLTLIQTALDIITLGLFCIDHGNSPFGSADRCDRDPARLSSQEHINFGQIKDFRKRIGYSSHKITIDPVI